MRSVGHLVYKRTGPTEHTPMETPISQLIVRSSGLGHGDIFKVNPISAVSIYTSNMVLGIRRHFLCVRDGLTLLMEAADRC